MANIAARSGWRIANNFQQEDRDNISILNRLLSREYMFVKYPVNISNHTKQLYLTLWDFMNDFVFPSEGIHRRGIERQNNIHLYVFA